MSNFFWTMGQVASTCAILLGLGAIGWAIAAYLLPGCRTSIRASAALLVSLWSATFIFIGLSAIEAFTPLVAAVTVTALATVAMRLPQGHASRLDLLATDIRSTFDLGRLVFRSIEGFVCVFALAVLAVRLWRGLVAPSMAWDDLTYHLFRAGTWATSGGWSIQAAPNAWGYSQYFPQIGDSFWAWAMLGAHGDGLLPIANVVMVAITITSCYALLRTIDVVPVRAATGALAVAFTPASMNFTVSGYVEPISMALFLVGSLFVLRNSRSEAAPGDCILACCAFGLALGVKVSNLIFVGPGLLWVALALARRQHLTWSTTSMAALALAICLPPFVRAWIDTGSPSYPIPVIVGGTQIWAGNVYQSLIFSLPLGPAGSDTALNLLRYLFLPRSSDYEIAGQFMNLGPSLLILAAPAFVGFRNMISTKRDRMLAVFMSLVTSLLFVSILSADTINLRTYFGWSLGRFLLPAAVTIVVFSATSTSPWARPLVLMGLMVNIALAIPLGLSRVDVAAFAGGAWVALLAVAIGAAIMLLLVVRKRVTLGAMFFVCGWLVCLTLLQDVRSQYRYEFYAELARGRAFSVNKDAAMLAASWPMWKAMDQKRSLNLAITGDWGSMSPLGARFPFLGSRLQNAIRYVPVTTSGEVVDRPEFYQNLSAGDYDAWVTRLQQQRIDYIVALSEQSIEAGWARSHPDKFSPAQVEPFAPGAIYRFSQK